MDGFDADRVVDDFVAGRLTRLDLVARLMALGAALGGAPAGARPSPGAAPAPPTYSAQSVDHVALSVGDVSRSAEWYVRHLALRVTRQDESSTFLSCAGRGSTASYQFSRWTLTYYASEL